MALLDKAKAVCRVTSTAFDTEITDLISSALSDLKITDIDSTLLTEDDTDPLILRAVMTYVSMNFKLNNGQIDVSVYEALRDSYNTQKAQMIMATGYTVWDGDSDE